MGWRQRAAAQMDRDGIRRLSAGEISPNPAKNLCGHVEYRDEHLSIGCKNAARYHVRGVGKRCFKHAIDHASTGAELAAGTAAVRALEQDIRTHEVAA